jgi:Flp pilus assembly protein TadD
MARIAPRLLVFAAGCAGLSAQSQAPSCDCTRMLDIQSIGAVSVRSLAHKPPKAARKEFNRGIQAWRKGRSDQALARSAKAARLDPDYLEAQVDLGVVYESTGHFSQALERFEQALALETNLQVLYENEAGVLMMLGRLYDAEETARLALRFSRYSIDANYTLGMSLVMRGEVTPEAIASLKLAAAKDPRARKALEAIEKSHLSGP